ncbi:MAG: hypothetical protein NWF07_07890 [Candidatus Bathyarchaeota archaeon]|nr:hypothetical protein [Candidatus Bathyarchaeota archaeon]
MIQLIQSIAAPTNWFMFLIVLLSVAFLTGLMVAYNRYSGTGGKYDPVILLRKYGLVIVLLLVVGFGYINLDNYCVFNVSSDKPSYSVGEVIEINCTINNPLPIPVYYRGHTLIEVTAEYNNGSSVQRFYFSIKEIAAEDAAEAARIASGEVYGRGFIASHGEKRVRTTRYLPKYIGMIQVMAECTDITGMDSANLSLEITEYQPVWVDVNSSGISLFLDENEENRIIVLVNNSNAYPVRIPVYSPVITHFGSPDSELRLVEYIDWVNPYWDILAYSAKQIHRTMSHTGTVDTPVYVTIYGITLRYPPQ